MAAPSSLYRSSITIDSISRSFGSLSQGLNKSRKTIAKINKNVSSSNEVKRKSLTRSSLLFQRKRENIRRKKQKSLLELSRLGSVFAAPSAAISNTGKSFLGRMMSFAGAIMAGWLVYNLPTIAMMANELGARVVRLTQILGEFLPNTGRIITNLGDVLGAYTTNILSFDFFDNSKRVEKSMDKLNSEFLRMHDSFNEALTLFTTPLTEGLGGRPSAPPFGTEYPQGQGPSGGGGGGGGRWKPLFDAIGAGEGTYTSMYPSENYPQLTSMTIEEVIQFQKQKLKDGRASAAVGRYQMLYPEKYAAAAGLPLTAKFSPENQDKMAGAYIEKYRRGNDWLNGKITDEQFGYELAKEFAGLKQPNGVGYYDKDGRNKATVDWAVTKEALKKVKSTPPPTSRPSPTPSPTPTGPKGTLKLIPQTGSGGLIQGSTGKSTGTHFHLDDKTGNYTPEVLANIREVAFRAIKAMQARGSTVFLTNYSVQTPASKNDSILRSQILQEQQKHDERSTPGVDIQEQNPNVRSTYPGWPGSATKFPYAVGAVKWRGGYGNEAEIIGSNGVTVSHGAEGSKASEIPQQVSSTRLSSTQIASAAKPLNAAVATAPERKGSTVIVMPQEQQPQRIPQSSGSSLPSSSVAQAPINNSRNIFLTDLAYT